MIIDNKFSERYHVIDDYGVSHGWPYGWQLFDQMGSPLVNLEVQETKMPEKHSYSNPLDMNIWPDTKDYDQNNPGILEKVKDLDKRAYQSDIEKAFWLNVTRVPICVSYLAACAKVRPMTILELGTGGDSAHSTGMFLYWLNGMFPTIIKIPSDSINIDDLDLKPGHIIETKDPPEIIMSQHMLVSVDRHPLSNVWPRYRDNKFWHFIQGDSITVMKKILGNFFPSLPTFFDMIFIDSSHTYPHTLKEIEQASFMAHAILMDDTTVEEVKKSLEEFLVGHREWLRIDLAHGVTLIERHDYV